MTLLAGLHDREGAPHVPAGGWCVDTVALSERPAAPDYTALGPELNWIARLNWGYGTTGTIPPRGGYVEFARRCAEFVRSSRGCRRWIIGNEPNLPREWPDNQAIHPQDYATCYAVCRAAIQQVPGHERDEVLVAGPGPWNAEYQYAGNADGDWVLYFEHVLSHLGDQLDGFAIHSYTHGYDIHRVGSLVTMDAPFDHRLYEFAAYTDYLDVIPSQHARLPVYLTEANGNGPWQAVGLIPAMLEAVQRWNQYGKPKIRAVVFFRYPEFGDGYGMADKPEVMAEFAAAAPRFAAPESTATAPHVVRLPKLELAPAPLVKPVWDMRLSERGVFVAGLGGDGPLWQVVLGRWLDEAESEGRHHIYVDVLDEAGRRVVGVPLLVNWPGGSARIITEAKPGEPYAANFPMTPSRNEFSIRVDDGTRSDLVAGIGMGAQTPTGYNAGIHTSTVIHFRKTTMQEPAPTPAAPPVVETPTPTPPAGGRTLIDPFMLEALLRVESSGQGMTLDGQPVIRLEAHLLLSPTFGNPAVFEPYFKFNRDNTLEAWYRPNPRQQWQLYHGAQLTEWAAMHVALRLDAPTAISCASWGLGQVMGFHWRRLGYGSAQAFAAAMGRGEGAQLIAVINYILTTPGLVEAINRRDLPVICRLYNGVGFEHIYIPRLERILTELTGGAS